MTAAEYALAIDLWLQFQLADLPQPKYSWVTRWKYYPKGWR